MQVVLAGALFVTTCVLVSLLVLWIVRRTVPHQTLAPHNDVAGFVYATIAVSYAVLLGMALIALWEKFDDADRKADAEANAVANLFRLAGGLPSPAREAVQTALVDYSRTAVEEEWPAMEEGSALHAEAMAPLDAVWGAFEGANPEAGKQLELYDQSLTELNALGDLRGERLLVSDEGLLGVIWLALIGGAIVTVIFPCIFGVENGGVHGIVIACLAGMLGLLLFVALELNYPFRGDVHVQPHGFERFLDRYDAPTAATAMPSLALAR